MRFRRIVLLALIFGISTYAFAQNPQSQQSQAPATFSQEDRATAQEQLRAVGELFGVKQDSPTPAQKEATPPTTMAEVTNKALDMVGNAVGTIAEIVQRVAPEVWEIMIRQQYAKAIAGIIVPLGLIVLAWTMALVAKRFFPQDDPPTTEYFNATDTNMTWRGTKAAWTTLIPTVVTVILGIWFFNRFSDSVLYLINPKYYAVQDLLRMLLNR